MAFVDRDAAFRALREHPDFEAWMSHDPDALDARGCRDAAGLLALLLVGAVLSILGVAFLPQLALVPLVLALVGAVTLAAHLLRAARHRAPLRRWPARVVDVQAAFTSRTGTSGKSRYLATLEEEGGTRSLHEASSEVAASLRPALLGVAFTRQRELVLFAPLVS